MRSSKFEIQSWNLELSLSLWNLDTLQSSICPPTLNFTLELRANFGHHKLGPNRQKKKIARDPPMQSLFLRRTSIAQSRSFQQVLGGLGRTSGGLGDALGETWAKLAKKKKSRGTPLYNAFFEKEKHRRVSRFFEPTSKARILDTAPEPHYSRL